MLALGKTLFASFSQKNVSRYDGMDSGDGGKA